MVRILPTDIPADDQELLDYLSDDSVTEDDANYLDHLNERFNNMEPLVTLDTTFPDTVVIVGVPKVGCESVHKLRIVLERKINEVLRSKGGELTGGAFELEIIQAENGLTKGFCFLMFNSEFEATHAVKSLNNLALDAKHKFKAALLDEIEMIVSRDDKFRAPMKILGFTREKFRWWLYDPRGREQFCIRYDLETEIFWHDPVDREPVLVYNGHRERAEGKRLWTDFRVQWSTQGSYLATFHKPGVALWAGDSFDKKVRFEHKDVKHIDFSPNEEYLITWDGSPSALKNDRSIRVWKVMTGQLLRSFATPEMTPRGTDFPHLIWSHDDKFVARMAISSDQQRATGETTSCSQTPGIKSSVPYTDLFIYELPEMTLTKDRDGNKVPLKYQFDKFDWSPGDNILSVWIPATTDSPGRLLLIDMPSRIELATKNVYNVEDASMHWQEKGDFLCLRAAVVKKTGKKGRKKITQLEIFRIREKNIPIDNIQIDDVAVKQLHWEEGYSKRFALIVQDENTNSQSVWFYRVSDYDPAAAGGASGAAQSIRRGGDTQRVCVFEILQYMNFMKWSPAGTHFMLAAMGTDANLFFCALNEQDRVEILHKDEHFMVNELKWSSCGRYVSTSVCIRIIAGGATAPASNYRLAGEAGYNIWTFQGKLQHTARHERFHQFLWRPHPPSLLSRQQIDHIKKNIKEFSRKYDVQDDSIKEKQRGAWLDEREKEMDALWKIYNDRREWLDSQPESTEWIKAAEEFDSQFEWENREEIYEEECDCKEEVIS